jgi:circadian clock protein KaiC
MSERVSSGQAPLDSILEGGFPINSINLIMGLPGTGKTILTEAIVFANATASRKAVYFSTVSEPLDKIVRYLQGFSFFRAEAVQDYVVFEDLSELLRGQNLGAALSHIKTVIRELNASIVVIDSFKALRAFSSDDEFRRGLHELAAVSTALPITSFWVGEYAAEDVHALPEFAVADGVLELVLKKAGTKDRRYLRVLKMRGSGFRDGEHAYRISTEGMQVFPRLTTPSAPAEYELLDVRAGTGVTVLDAMVQEGFWKGGSTIVFGPPGSGKTLLGLHFLFRGVDVGEKGVILSLQENPTQLARIVRRFGWDLKAAVDAGMLRVMYVSPVEAYIDEVMYELVQQAHAFGAERVVVDSLSDLEAAAADAGRFRDFTYALVQDLAAKRVSLLMTAEIKNMFGTSYQTEFGVSHMSDNVVLLHYVREQSEVKRAIAVLKTRASDHDPRIRQFTISANGICVGEEFSGMTNFIGL